MAATAANMVFDIVSWAKQRDPSFKAATIAELLSQCNEAILDSTWVEGNSPDGHQITQRTGLPTTYTRQVNQAVQVSRGQTAQITEGMSIFETWAEYDNKIIDRWGDRDAFLYIQSLGFIESMAQKWANSFIYGDPSVDPTQFLGLAARFSTLNPANAANAVNVIDGGGTGSTNTSVWLVTHSPKALTSFFAKGTAAGIQHFVKEDQVIQSTLGVGGGRLRGHQEQWTMDCGLALADWRWVSRLANIDVPSLRNNAGSTDLRDGMIDMQYRMPSMAKPPSSTGNPTSQVNIPGRQCYYANRAAHAALRKQMIHSSGGTITMEDWFGFKLMHVDGIPVRLMDQISNFEARVV